MNSNNISRYVDTDGNIYRVNHEKGTYKRVNCLRWIFLSKEEFEALETKKVNTHKYNTLLNKFFKKEKIEWEYNGDIYRALDPIETNEYGMMTNYQLWGENDKRTDKNVPKLPWFKVDRWYGHGFIAMFRGVVGYVTPYRNGGYQFLDIKTKEAKQWVTLKNLRPIMNMTTKKLVGEQKP